MDNLDLLFLENDTCTTERITVHNKSFVYKHNGNDITAQSLKVMIKFINTLRRKFPNFQLPVVFDMGQAHFFDKLTYIMFECLCDYLIENCNYKVSVSFDPKTMIHTAGIHSSPLWLLTTGQGKHIIKFKDHFNFEIYKNHYRRVLTKNDFDQPTLLCKIMDDVATFQKPYNIDAVCREKIAEVIVELIGNAGEHGEANCLVDFDIAPSYSREGTDAEFLGLNLAVINFSSQVFSSALERKIKLTDIDIERYKAVRIAYRNHSEFFNEKYTETDFFNLTAFQHKISGRENSITGGTGLTRLIESLETMTEAHMCYMHSGQRVVIFEPEYLRYNDDGWIGFNKNNDYFSTAPNKELFYGECYTLPGTAFNLNFVIKKEC